MPPNLTALLLVDVQRNMLEGPEPVATAAVVRTAVETLLTRARGSGAVVVHVQNEGGPGEPDEPGTEGWELVFPVAPGEEVVGKDTSDTFAANPDLAASLHERGVGRVVVAGMQSNYCVLATCRGAKSAGFDVALAAGAHATYDEEQPAAAIEEETETTLATEGVPAIAVHAVTFS